MTTTDWRDFDDRDAHQDRLASELATETETDRSRLPCVALRPLARCTPTGTGWLPMSSARSP